jgi:hypothetical protein
MVLLFIKCRKRKPRKKTWFPNEDVMQEEEAPGEVQEEAPGGEQEEGPGQFRCTNCGRLGHRKNSPKYHLNATRKRQDSTSYALNGIHLVSLI